MHMLKHGMMVRISDPLLYPTGQPTNLFTQEKHQSNTQGGIQKRKHVEVDGDLETQGKYEESYTTDINGMHRPTTNSSCAY